MKFKGKIERITDVQKGISSQGNEWQSCKIVAWAVNESGIVEKVLLSCLNASCEKAQVLGAKYVNTDGSFSGEFEFFFTPSVRKWTDRNGKEQLSQELNLNHVVEL